MTRGRILGISQDRMIQSTVFNGDMDYQANGAILLEMARN